MKMGIDSLILRGSCGTTFHAPFIDTGRVVAGNAPEPYDAANATIDGRAVALTLTKSSSPVSATFEDRMTSEADHPTVAKTIADQTYQHIRRDIISGALAPGTKLAMEMLTKRYDVGLSPLREALVKLTGDALAVAEGQRGFWVSPISLEELRDTMNTRLLIETQALSLAMEHGGPEWERAIAQAYEELSVLEDKRKDSDAATVARWENANRRFHDALVSACGSQWLIRLRGMLHYHSERYRMISLAEASVERDVHDEHEAIAEAVLARKTLRACRLLELHLQRTTDVVRLALERRDEELLNKTKKRGGSARRVNKPRG